MRVMRFILKSVALTISFMMVHVLGIAEAQEAEIKDRANKQLSSDKIWSPNAFQSRESQPIEDAFKQFRKELDDNALNLSIPNDSRSLTPDDAAIGLGGRLNGAGEGAVQQLTLQEARKLALHHNLNLQINKIDPIIADTFLREERAKFDNTIFANLQYASKRNPTISGDTVKFSSDDVALKDKIVKLTQQSKEYETVDAEIGLSVPLRTGGKVTVSSPLEYKQSNGAFSSEEYRSALLFSFSQPLLRNAGTEVNEASIRIAELEQTATNVRTRLQAIRIIAMIDKAYWEVYRAWNELEVRQQQYNLASQNLNLVDRRIKEGLSAVIERNRAEVGVADRLEALIMAKTKLKISQRLLKFYLNDDSLSILSDHWVNPESKPTLLNFSFERDKLIQTALSQRLELLEQELKLAADANKIDYLENQTLPVFMLDYKYGALSESQGTTLDAYQDVGRLPNWSIGLRFEMPVTNEARKAKLSRAIEERTQRLTTRTLKELEVKREILDTLDEMDQNWQRVLAARQQVFVAGINYEAELKQFKEGLRTMTEVLESLTRLGEAQLREIRAVSDYQVSQVDLAYATGNIIGFSQIEFAAIN